MASDNASAEHDPPSALPRGTRLGEFEILRVLGIGGFGIVYLAFDHQLEREVAVKEYMPSALAGRTATLHVSLRSQNDSDTFALGLKSFVNEARLLARFDHPSLLKVHRFWEANGTAYMAMPVYRGRTLKDVRATLTEPPDEARLRAWLEPLLGALGTLHDAGVYHRDIAPDNIVLEPDGHPVLLDFGAARRVISDRSQTLTAILKPAYAPIEQYAEAGAVKQGPWTDIYALGATLHFLLLARPPAPATARAVHDEQPPLSTMGLNGCSTAFLDAIDWMLAPRPADRPQTVAALRDVLEGRAPLPAARGVQPPAAWERTQTYDQPTMVVPRTAAPPATTTQPPGEDDTIIVPLSSMVPQAPTAPAAPPHVTAPAPVPAPPPKAQPAAPAVPPAPPPAAAGGGSRVPLIAAVVVVLLAGGAFALWPRSPAPAPVPAAAAPAPEPAASVATAPAPVPAPVAAPEPAPAPPPVVVAAPPPPAPVAAPPAPAPKPAVAEARPAANGPKPAPAKASAPAPAPVVAEPAHTPAPAPRQAPAPAPAPVAEAPAAAPAPAPVQSPRERCGGRVLVALSICMERECGKAELKQHAECVKWRADLDRLANPTN